MFSTFLKLRCLIYEMVMVMLPLGLVLKGQKIIKHVSQLIRIAAALHTVIVTI